MKIGFGNEKLNNENVKTWISFFLSKMSKGRKATETEYMEEYCWSKQSNFSFLMLVSWQRGYLQELKHN